MSEPKTKPDTTKHLSVQSECAWLNFSAALKADPSWLWTYHCNLAMAIHDNAPQRSVPIGYCNMIAATFLNRAFNLRVTDPNGVDELHKFYHEAGVEHTHCSLCKKPEPPYRFCRHALTKCAHCEGRADEEAMPQCKHGIMQLRCLVCTPHDFE